MIGGFFRFLFFIFIALLVFRVLKLIFQIGKTAGEFSQKVDEMKRSDKTSNSAKKGDVIELDKNQYKVE